MMQSWKTLEQVRIVHHTYTKHPFVGLQYRAKKICVKPLAHLGKLSEISDQNVDTQLTFF